MKTFTLVISTHDGTVFEEDVLSISVRGTEGNLSILANHIPFITSIKPCKCSVKLENGQTFVGRTDKGILAVSHDRTTLLSDGFHFE